MNIQDRLLLSLMLLVLNSYNSFADSPITSTTFGTAYLHESIVSTAANSKGDLTKKMLVYLAEDSNPIGVKLALINQLGWRLKGKNNGNRYFKYLMKTRNYKNEGDLLESSSGDEIVCLTYLYAIDNYFEMKNAILYAEVGIFKNPGSYAAQMIRALVNAQDKFNQKAWCESYNFTDGVRNNPEIFYRDLNQAAIDIIFGYMDIYKKSCKN